MGLEIERKFIVPLEYHPLFVPMTGGTRQIQAYLSEDPSRHFREDDRKGAPSSGWHREARVGMGHARRRGLGHDP